MFSLAALMHELLWGRRVSALGGQAGDALTDLPGADLDALRALFARALAERADDRFDTALEFAQALTQAFPDVAIAAPRAREDAVPSASSAEPPDALDVRLPLDEPAPALVAARSVKNVSRVRNEPPATPKSRGAPNTRIRPSISICASRKPRDTEAVDAAPAIVDLSPGPAPETDRLDETPSGLTGGYVEPPTSALERSRSALWPLALALIVGIAIGFAGGYGVGSARSVCGASSSRRRADARGGARSDGGARGNRRHGSDGREGRAGPEGSAGREKRAREACRRDAGGTIAGGQI